ncbi:Uma2 family endonuclease [Persicitalea sp.]|uniref:Uma2 family endonuclease n=1 Tax=Persicitalea sp. TaxID=3100273 RepID=UPI003593C25E
MVLENGFLIQTVDGITEEMFFDLCQANRDLRMERDQYGNITIMSPTGMSTGNFNAEFLFEVVLWNRETQLGYVFDSSSGYTLPNGAVRSPDVSWIAKERWEGIPEADRKVFTHTYPDFVVEIRSESDRLKELKAKMEEYRTNGCRLGWLIDRKGKAVYIYRANGDVEIVKGESVALSGEGVLPGLVVEVGL